MYALLHLLARRARWCLVAGLFAGLAAPALADTLRPAIGPLVALLLLLTGCRIGARAAFGSLGAMRRGLLVVLALQIALPLAALGLLSGLGLLHLPFALAAALMLAAPSVTGAPNFTIMLGHDPAPGLRVLVLGTALFPLSALPVLWTLTPDLAAAARLAGTLLIAIIGAVGLGFVLRRAWPHPFGPADQRALDGAAALVLGIVVVGLMAAIGPLVRSAPMTLLGWLLAVMALNFALQITCAWVLRGRAADWVPLSIVAGNRNIALYLMVLPAEVSAPLMIFVGCYQVPMYLTPILLAPLYRRAQARRAT